MSAYSDKVIADGATAYWRLGETAGLVANDSKGTKHGTISGGVTLAQPGALADGNQCMTFNGTTGKIVMPAVAMVPPVTLELWFKLSANGSYPMAFSTRDGTSNGDGFAIYMKDASRVITWSVTYAGGSTVFGEFLIVLPNIGQWYHLVCVFQAASVQCYIDGVNVGHNGGGSYSIIGSTQRPAVIGNVGALYWPGSLDEIAIYSGRALTPAQISEHHALRTATAGPGQLPAGDKTTLWHNWQVSTQNWNNEETAIALGALPPKDLTTELQNFLGQGRTR